MTRFGGVIRRVIVLAVPALAACNRGLSAEEKFNRDLEEAAGRARAQGERRKAQAEAEEKAARAEASAMVARAVKAPPPYVESPERIAERAALDALTPQQRSARVRELCGSQACDESEARGVASTCKSPPECAALDAIVAVGARAKSERAKGQGERSRVEYAESYEAGLLQRRMNPDGVSATGAEKRTLTVRGWFCSRQFCFDVMNGPMRAEMTAVGFRHLTCHGMQTWDQDL